MANKDMRTIDGITLEIQRCNHCKATPTDEEVRQAMRWRHEVQPVCAICSKSIAYVHKYVSHQPEEGEAFAWKSYGDWEPAIRVSGQQSTDPKLAYLNLWAHTACLRAAIPNLDALNKPFDH